MVGQSVAASSVSPALLAKAKREGRFSGGRIYRSAQAAAQSKSGGKGKKGGKKSTGLASNRELVEVPISQTVTATNGVHEIRCHLNGELNDLPRALRPFQSRNYLMTGVEVSFRFPLFGTGHGRFAVGFANEVSAGDKTPAQVSTLSKAQLFDSVVFIDKKVKLAMPGPVRAAEFDEAGNLLTPQGKRGVMIASVELAGGSEEDVALEYEVAVKFTLTVDKIDGPIMAL